MQQKLNACLEGKKALKKQAKIPTEDHMAREFARRA